VLAEFDRYAAWARQLIANAEAPLVEFATAGGGLMATVWLDADTQVVFGVRPARGEFQFEGHDA